MWILTSAMVTVVALTTSDIKSDEVVVFYPGCAHLAEDGKSWTVPVHGVIYEPEAGSVKRALLVRSIRRAVRVEQDTAEAQILDRRVRHFLVDHERGKEISIRLGTQVYQVGTSGPNGHFGGTFQLPVADARRLTGTQRNRGNWISFEAVTRKDDRRRFTGRVQLIGPTGLSCISDLDDTIKISQVTNRKAMLTNTFLRDFRPVPGMSELYREWAERGTAFHYVSGSPWQLYLPLSSFVGAQRFPPGSFQLKHFRLKDPTALNLLMSQEAYKLSAIESILATYPRRLFVLVGDSGEEDPEIYGKVARGHPEQVVAVLIRNVTGEAPQGERFRKAFEGMAEERWKVFRQPDEIGPLMTGLMRAPGTEP